MDVFLNEHSETIKIKINLCILKKNIVINILEIFYHPKSLKNDFGKL